MATYYNEFDPHAAEWLRELIRAGHLPAGDVDTRSIEDVRPDDLRGYAQCHFFAGIGGWPLALRLAGWPDERHLWPAFFHLITQRAPAVVFGEQVASKDGREWLGLVRADMEGMGYAVGAADLCAAGVGAPHIRQRLYWVAGPSYANRTGLPRPLWGGSIGATGVTPAWRSVERIHAEGLWQTWVSESGASALADGVPARVVRLRGYGNAIVPQVAAAFIDAYVNSVIPYAP